MCTRAAYCKILSEFCLCCRNGTVIPRYKYIFNLVFFGYTFLLCLRRSSVNLPYEMYHIDASLCQAVIQVLLSMKSHRLANTPIRYRYTPRHNARHNSASHVFRLFGRIREIEIYVILDGNFHHRISRFGRARALSRA